MSPAIRLFRRMWPGFQRENAVSCVGIIALAGSLTLVVSPDDLPPLREERPDRQARSTVILDPGHGGNDNGAQSRGLVEKWLTLDIAARTAKVLQQYNFPTVLTRRDDVYVSLAERAAIGNRYPNSIFVSIHFNHGLGEGIETFYASEKILPEADWTWTGFFNSPTPSILDRGESLAGFLQSTLVHRTEAQNRGVRGRPLFVVRHTRSPAALVECGFLSNPLEARLIMNESYRDLLARGIAEGILGFEKTKMIPPGTAPKLADGKP